MPVLTEEDRSPRRRRGRYPRQFRKDEAALSDRSPAKTVRRVSLTTYARHRSLPRCFSLHSVVAWSSVQQRVTTRHCDVKPSDGAARNPTVSQLHRSARRSAGRNRRPLCPTP